MASKNVAQGPLTACALSHDQVFVCRFGDDPNKPILAAIISAADARRLAQELIAAADVASRSEEVSHG